MRVKEDDDGTLVLKGDILEGAKEAYRKDRIVEAFALLHALIEWRMVNLYQQSHISKGGYLLEIIEKKDYFRTISKELRKKKLIVSSEYTRLHNWYRLRNKIIHRLVLYSYQPSDLNKVTREEVQEGFLEGETLAEMLRERALELYL